MIETGTLAPAAALPLVAAYAAEMRGMLAGHAVARAEAAMALLPPGCLIGAFMAGEPVGFLVLLELPEIVFARRCGQVEDLFVRPDRRGRGVARALLAAAEAAGRARDWSHLRWFVPAADVAAIALYERVAARTDWRGYILRLDPAASL